jgi:hypothetical protein
MGDRDLFFGIRCALARVCCGDPVLKCSLMSKHQCKKPVGRSRIRNPWASLRKRREAAERAYEDAPFFRMQMMELESRVLYSAAPIGDLILFSVKTIVPTLYDWITEIRELVAAIEKALSATMLATSRIR